MKPFNKSEFADKVVILGDKLQELFAVSPAKDGKQYIDLGSVIRALDVLLLIYYRKLQDIQAELEYNDLSDGSTNFQFEDKKDYPEIDWDTFK